MPMPMYGQHSPYFQRIKQPLCFGIQSFMQIEVHTQTFTLFGLTGYLIQ